MGEKTGEGGEPQAWCHPAPPLLKDPISPRDGGTLSPCKGWGAWKGLGCSEGIGVPHLPVGIRVLRGVRGPQSPHKGLGCSGRGSRYLEGVGVPSPLAGVGVPKRGGCPAAATHTSPPRAPHAPTSKTTHPSTALQPRGHQPPHDRLRESPRWPPDTPHSPPSMPGLPGLGVPSWLQPPRDQHLPLEPNNCSVLCCAVSMAPGPSFVGTCCGECLPFNYLPSSCSCLLTAWHRRLRPPPRPPAPRRPGLSGTFRGAVCRDGMVRASRHAWVLILPWGEGRWGPGPGTAGGRGRLGLGARRGTPGWGPPTATPGTRLWPSS